MVEIENRTVIIEVRWRRSEVRRQKSDRRKNGEAGHQDKRRCDS
jgi:hypothetical protein